MKALVTGAAGFIGSHLCERLLLDGWHVQGIDCFTDFYDRARKQANVAGPLASSRFRLTEVDLAVDPLEDLLGDADVVFHLAAQPGVHGSWGQRFDVYLRNNVLATQRLLEAAASRATRFVYASSSSVYGIADRLPVGEDDRTEPVSPYGVTKLAAEQLVRLYARAHGVPGVVLRYFTVYGPRQRPDMAFSRFIDSILSDEPLVLHGSDRSRDFTFVDDVVDATVRAADAPPGRIYNVGGGAPAPLDEAIDVLEDLTGKRAWIERCVERPGDPQRTSADTTRAQRELGWMPRWSLRDGLASQVAWTRARGGSRRPSARLLSGPRTSR